MKKFEQKIMEYEMYNRSQLIQMQEEIRFYKKEIDKQKKADHISLSIIQELSKKLDKLVEAYDLNEETASSFRFVDDTYDFENFDGKFSILHEKSKIDFSSYMFNPYYRGIYKVSKKHYECLSNLNIDNVYNFNSRFKNNILNGLHKDKSISQILDSPFFLKASKKYFK